MDQQQNQQQPNNLQKKAEQVFSAPFAMPVIRTMADDLSEASKTINIPISAPVKNVPVKTVEQPNASSKPATPLPSPTILPKPPVPPRPISAPVLKPIPVQPVSSVVLPIAKEEKTGGKKSFWVSILVGAVVTVLICVVGFGAYYFWPKKTNTIADLIPQETIAFISIKRDAGALEKSVLPKIYTAVGVGDGVLGTNWKNLVYGILPGSSSSEPVSYLWTDDAESVNVGVVSNLAEKKLANNTAIITDAGAIGRLDGLNGKTLGDNNDFRALLKKLPASPEYIYVAKNERIAWLQPFSLFPIDNGIATLIAVALSPQGGNKLALMGAQSGDKEFVKRQLLWDQAIKAIPADVLALTGHSDLSGDAEQWRLGQSGNAGLQDLLNALTANGENIIGLKDNLASNYVVGTLANETVTPEGVAVMTIKEGATENVKTQMRQLEEALKLLGPLIGGAPYKDAIFEDNIYKDTAIRYVNFGDSNHSFDYAIVDSLLLVSTSKGSMQRMIDTYKGEGENFTATFTAQGTGQVEWQYLKFDTVVLDKLPIAWKTLLGSFTSVYTEPISTGVFSGNIAY